MTQWIASSGLFLAQWNRDGGSMMLPPQNSTIAPSIDWVFNFIFWICIVFFIIIVGAMVMFIVAYRRTPQRMKATSDVTHNTPLELGWSVLPGMLLVPIFWWGYDAFMDLRQVPADAYQVKVWAQQWAWSFEYPNGHQDSNLHVPAGRPVLLTMNSSDVLHSLYIPDFRVKQDVVPGRFTKLWFQADKPGEHNLHCTEYCGKDHSNMNAQVIVHSTEDFPTWLANADPLSKLTEDQVKEWLADPDAFIKAHPEFEGLEPPVVVGKKLHKKKGCVSCHSLDGAANTGPTWKGLWGKKAHVVLEGGAEKQVEIDENYIRTSILYPANQISKGYQNAMTAYQGRIKDREIMAIVEYMKTLTEK
ncbi:MAG: cytochrome c oxidase subunit II [Phycisphaerae bacterium]|nr:cytochrome c oxidase subunit II [Phycisphaerae bacterium]